MLPTPAGLVATAAAVRAAQPLFRAALLAPALCASPALAAALPDPPAAPPAARATEEKVLHLPMRTAGPGFMDPVRGSTVYDSRAIQNCYETLLQYKYLKRPLELEPLLLAEMPTASEDGLTWTFRLREGVRFHDDPCFPDGKGRELVSEDVFYSWKRLADLSNEPKNWWLFENTVVGFDEYRDAQNAASRKDGEFDYDAPVEGFKVLDDHSFQVVLKEPIYRFLYVLAMAPAAVVPREATEKYGTSFTRHPVGTGPFTMREEDWVINKSMTFRKNPTYWGSKYPTEWMPEDEQHGLHHAAGKTLPFVDRMEVTMWPVEQGMWLEFRQGSLDYTQVPDEFFDEAIKKRSRKLKSEYEKAGITLHAVPLTDFIFRGFNMEDPLLGGYSDQKKWLRQAISLATDLGEFNDTFYSGTCIVYDGPIPPGLEGYPERGYAPVSYRGPDLERARELLAKAGYPGGEGLPPIEYYTSSSGNIPQQTEMMKRQLSEIGIQLNSRLLNFAQLIEALNTKKAPLFSYAWSTDYPDAENNLALFYGPNETPGSNRFNYKSAEFDALYEKVRTMGPSPERTEMYERMRDMTIEDCAFIGSLARTRFYLLNPWLKNYKPVEDFENWMKYLDVDESARKK